MGGSCELECGVELSLPQFNCMQVMEVKFPGFPAPPLGVLVKICTSIENWLNADADNIAVIHCMVSVSLVICVFPRACLQRGYLQLTLHCSLAT